MEILSIQKKLFLKDYEHQVLPSLIYLLITLSYLMLVNKYVSHLTSLTSQAQKTMQRAQGVSRLLWL